MVSVSGFPRTGTSIFSAALSIVDHASAATTAGICSKRALGTNLSWVVDDSYLKLSATPFALSLVCFYSLLVGPTPTRSRSDLRPSLGPQALSLVSLQRHSVLSATSGSTL